MKDRNIALLAGGIVLLACICGALVLLAGSIYGLSALVDWSNQVNAWAAQGNTCYASAFVPLSAGLFVWRHRKLGR